MPAERHPEPTCPRCGYDLRGSVATWQDRSECPIEGVCAECGLAFEWADLLASERRPPAWSFEHCPRPRFLHACAGTFGRSFMPWRLWRRLRMEHRARPRRLAAYAVVSFLIPLILLYVAVQTTAAVYVRYQTERGYAEVRRFSAQQLARYQALAAQDPEVAAQNEARIANLQFVLSVPLTIHHGYTDAVFEAIFFPTRQTSQGVITGPYGAWPYHAPRSLFSEIDMRFSDAMRPAGRGYPRWVRNRAATDPFVMLLAGMIVLLLVPLSMALLPISRRRARVRWEHVARVAACSAPLPIIVSLITLLPMAIALAAPALAGRLTGLGMIVAHLGLPLATFIWWWMAITRYFRMPHGWLVALVLTATCTLAVGVALFYIDDDFIVRAMM